jgi:hypothetical protein
MGSVRTRMRVLVLFAIIMAKIVANLLLSFECCRFLFMGVIMQHTSSLCW